MVEENFKEDKKDSRNATYKPVTDRYRKQGESTMYEMMTEYRSVI